MAQEERFTPASFEPRSPLGGVVSGEAREGSAPFERMKNLFSRLSREKREHLLAELKPLLKQYKGKPAELMAVAEARAAVYGCVAEATAEEIARHRGDDRTLQLELGDVMKALQQTPENVAHDENPVEGN